MSVQNEVYIDVLVAKNMIKADKVKEGKNEIELCKK